MKKYVKPIYELVEISCEDVILFSGVELSESNAGFDITDEVL